MFLGGKRAGRELGESWERAGSLSPSPNQLNRELVLWDKEIGWLPTPIAVTEDPGTPSGFIIPMDRKLNPFETIL
jgi:hypothetical protein